MERQNFRVLFFMLRQILICKYRPAIQKYPLNRDAFFEDAIFEDSVARLVIFSSINYQQILKHQKLFNIY